MNHLEHRRTPAALALMLTLIVTLTGCSRASPTRSAADQLDDAQLTASCIFADLDGAAPLRDAASIPIAHTPGCGYTEFPAPVLAGCNEPLPAHVPDLRGVWVDTGTPNGHLERVEQCGLRVTITAGHVLHDMVADGTHENGVNDVAARDCDPISVKAEFIDGVHTLSPKGLPLTVTRHLEGDQLIWDYPTGEYRLTRLCGPGLPYDPNRLRLQTLQ